MNQAKQEYRKVLAFRAAMSVLTEKELLEAHQQHEQMLQDTWNQLDQDEQAIEDFLNGS